MVGRYTGPDGAKRLELLEELARLMGEWVQSAPSIFRIGRACEVQLAVFAIERDNDHVDHVEQRAEAVAPSDDDDSRWRQ